MFSFGLLINTVAAQANSPTVKSILDKLQTQILQPVISLLFILATIIFMWGVIQYVIGSQGNETTLEKGKKVMFWGIIGMTVMASAWGIVRVLCNYFGTCGAAGL